MSTITAHKSTTVEVIEPTPAEALTSQQQDNLLLLAASHEKIRKVPGNGAARAWSRGGNVD